MKHKPKLFIETTVFNFYFEGKQGRKQQDPIRLFIATAVVNGLDFVVSYNYGHIVKMKAIVGAGLANLQEGYRQIGLCTPTEVIEYDR